MKEKKMLKNEELEKVNGGMTADKWPTIAANTLLYYCSGYPDRADARVIYTGNNKDIGWAFEQRLECKIIELYNCESIKIDGNNYKVGDIAWIPRGDLEEELSTREFSRTTTHF